MDSGNIVNIILTVIAILGAGAVALVVDMLKTHNERLREANLELRVRREEEQRRTELALDQLKRLSPVAADRVLAAAESAALMERPVAPIEGQLALAGEIGLPRAAEPWVEPEPAQPASAQVSTHEVEAGATLAEARMLAREFLGSVEQPHRQQPRENAHPEPVSQAVHQRYSQVSYDRPAMAAHTPANPEQRPARKNWDQLLKGARRATIDVTPVPALGRHRGELIPFESLQNTQAAHAAEAGLRLPSGFHGMGELSQLLEMTKPLDGMVVSIALNGTGGSDAAIPAGTLRGAASECVRSILQPGEFGCQSAIDQFLIISSAPAEPQRRLTEITERLWDFQLRSDLAATMVLSWGSYEASGEALSDAIAGAMKRMDENRRARTSATPQAGAGRRWAV